MTRATPPEKSKDSPSAIRSCTAASPRSAFSTIAPSLSRSPVSRAPGVSSSSAKTGFPGTDTASSVGATDQNGEAVPLPASGSSQARRPHRAASSVSEAVWVRTGNGSPCGGLVPAPHIHQSMT